MYSCWEQYWFLKSYFQTESLYTMQSDALTTLNIFLHNLKVSKATLAAISEPHILEHPQLYVEYDDADAGTDTDNPHRFQDYLSIVVKQKKVK